jgi:uncharacterized repeat protein (TIGR03803 family)
MGISRIGRYVPSVCAAAVMLAACGGSQPPIDTPGAMPLGSIPTATRFPPNDNDYRLLYGFKGATNGRDPDAGLVALGNALYGTTEFGGTGSCDYSFDPACGTAFSVTPSGKERVLYSFRGGEDGQSPFATLAVVKGNLYGTTIYGGGSSTCYGSSGNFGCGTVFKLTASGKEHVVYRFPGGAGGYEPYSGVTLNNSTLFGTTLYGGASDAGTVYSLSLTGRARIVYSFQGGEDGALPYAGLTLDKGTLYGTTLGGGLSSSCNNNGCGTVFAISKSGKEHVLHRFGATNDGISPVSGLTDVGGTLYGTTVGGGVYGEGTVFSISPSGSESVLYSFRGSGDGASPTGTLSNVGKMLYGTTHGGGARGNGTVFAITTSGKEKILYSFKSGADGRGPQAGLLFVNGVFYGTTTGGGMDGWGTIFRVSP